MSDTTAFVRGLAQAVARRSKVPQAAKHIQTENHITVNKPSNVVNTSDKLVLNADEQNEQYRITIINSAIAHIKANKPKGQ